MLKDDTTYKKLMAVYKTRSGRKVFPPLAYWLGENINCGNITYSSPVIINTKYERHLIPDRIHSELEEISPHLKNNIANETFSISDSGISKLYPCKREIIEHKEISQNGKRPSNKKNSKHRYTNSSSERPINNKEHALPGNSDEVKSHSCKRTGTRLKNSEKVPKRSINSTNKFSVIHKEQHQVKNLEDIESQTFKRARTILSEVESDPIRNINSTYKSPVIDEQNQSMNLDKSKKQIKNNFKNGQKDTSQILDLCEVAKNNMVEFDEVTKSNCSKRKRQTKTLRTNKKINRASFHSQVETKSEIHVKPCLYSHESAFLQRLSSSCSTPKQVSKQNKNSMEMPSYVKNQKDVYISVKQPSSNEAKLRQNQPSKSSPKKTPLKIVKSDLKGKSLFFTITDELNKNYSGDIYNHTSKQNKLPQSVINFLNESSFDEDTSLVTTPKSLYHCTFPSSKIKTPNNSFPFKFPTPLSTNKKEVLCRSKRRRVVQNYKSVTKNAVNVSWTYESTKEQVKEISHLLNSWHKNSTEEKLKEDLQSELSSDE